MLNSNLKSVWPVLGQKHFLVTLIVLSLCINYGYSRRLDKRSGSSNIAESQKNDVVINLGEFS